MSAKVLAFDPAVPFEAFGVHALLNAATPELLERARELLPPGWQPSSEGKAAERFEIGQEDGNYVVSVGDAPYTQTPDLDVALGVLDAQIRAYVSLRAPERVFVHAGAVAVDGKVILIPGPSFSGKTTLVGELVRAGAIYYSDEYAALDEEGLVHPYPKPLSVREDGTRESTDHPVAAFGGEAGNDPLPVGLVAITSYKPEARWEPDTRSRGEGALSLLENTVPARERPADCLSTLRKAVEGATVLEGNRGEASVAAHAILAAARDLVG